MEIYANFFLVLKNTGPLWMVVFRTSTLKNSVCTKILHLQLLNFMGAKLRQVLEASSWKNVISKGGVLLTQPRIRNQRFAVT